jgi:hypothetical protein
MSKFSPESVLQFYDMPEQFDATTDCLLAWNATSKRFVFLASASITPLTDNSAGTANNTIAAMPSPADAPATPDALRDDLVANFIPAVRDNFADLAAKVNAILAAITT